MDCDQEERKLFQSDQTSSQYPWILKNEYHQLYHGFVHDQNAKVKLEMKNDQAVFKLQEKLVKNGKNFEVNGTFWTWNVLSSSNQTPDQPLQSSSFIQSLIQKPSVIFGACSNNVKLQYRFGQKQYKRFKYNPFVSLETPKDLKDLNLSFGMIHRSANVNFLTKFTASVINPSDFIHKIRVDYAKNQMYFGLSSEITQGLSCKIAKSLVGYELSPGNNFYLRFQTQNIAQLIKGKQTYQQVGIYYIRKLNDDLKFGLGVKSINSLQNFLNLTVEKKTPYHIKARIDSKLNLSVTVRKVFNEQLALAYGIGASNLFQKRFRVQTGIVLEYDA